MLTTQDKHNLCCARLEGQTTTGYDWERAVKVSFSQSANMNVTIVRPYRPGRGQVKRQMKLNTSTTHIQIQGKSQKEGEVVRDTPQRAYL